MRLSLETDGDAAANAGTSIIPNIIKGMVLRLISSNVRMSTTRMVSWYRFQTSGSLLITSPESASMQNPGIRLQIESLQNHKQSELPCKYGLASLLSICRLQALRRI
jgi:hypothetical protein